MSIRRKLFFAFVAAAVLPIVALSVLARLYLERARVDVDQRFLDHAREATHAVAERANARTEVLKDALKRFGNEAFVGRVEVLKIGARVQIEGVLSDDLNAPEEAKKFRAAHPQVLGVKVMLEEEVLYSDLAQDYQYPSDGVALEIVDEQQRAPFQVGAPDGRRFMVLVLNGGSTRILVQIDPVALLEPMTVGGVRAFYLEKDGSLRHPPAAQAALASEIPVAGFAHKAPLGGDVAHVDIGDATWRIYSAPSADRDRWEYGGTARLVAVASEALIDAPLRRFRAEVLAVALLSLLVAVGLAYFLSGRFTDSVENLKRGVDALSRGEFAQLEKSSGDELGGELVDSMNRMASALAERTRREEIENWRRLVRVLSHEINNTLGPVKSVASTVRDTLSPKLEGDVGDDLKSSFRLIVDRVDSLSAFIAGYAVLAKLPPPERTPVDLNEVARGAVAMLGESASARSLTVEERYEDLSVVELDKQQMERVAINLVKNAVEAARSRVCVRTSRKSDTVQLIVEDDGPGIAVEARAHLFVPYYTTKPGGSGIGLALARQIVLGHGGSIAARDRDGGGTIVSVLLPTGMT